VRESKDIDLELVRRCQLGDEQAFDALWDRFSNAVWRLCLRMAGSSTEAEDLAQEVWVTVWRQIGTFRCQSAFQTWLYRVASNVCLQWLRSARRERFAPADPEIPDNGPSCETRAANKEQLQRTLAALAELPERLRLPLILRVYEDLPYAQISEALDCSVAAVKMRIARARAALAEALEGSDA
jgi:RNA polymerase sigma-70 factor, ECF subfamily